MFVGAAATPDDIKELEDGDLQVWESNVMRLETGAATSHSRIGCTTHDLDFLTAS